MIVIEGETWYGCKVCGKRFQQRNMFMRHHSQLHVGESVVSGQKHSDDERGEESLSSTGTSTIAPYCSYSDGGKSADEIFPYQCMLCRKCFDECGKLRIHVQRHDDVQKRLKCSVCSKTFGDSHKIGIHARRHAKRCHAERKLFECSDCGARFSLAAQLAFHVKSHERKVQFGCAICCRTLTRFEFLEHHVERMHRNDRSYQRQTCGEVLKRQRHLTARRADKHIHTQKKLQYVPNSAKEYTEESFTADGKTATSDLYLYLCMLCNCRFENGEGLRNHVQKHGRKKPFKCSVCKKTFDRSNNVQKHAQLHSAKVAFACSECDFRSQKMTDLIEHVKLHPTAFGCSLCRKSFGRLDHLSHHVKTIHGSTRHYKCGECGTMFKERHHLRDHEARFHSTADHLACKLCSRRFGTRSRHKRHMLVSHDVGSWHKCPSCPRKFIYPAYLKQHQRTHDNDMRYACSECARRFNSRSGLRTHLVWHSGARNFACGCCGRTFYRRSHVLNHFKVHLRQS